MDKQTKIRSVNLCNMYTVILHKNHLYIFIPTATLFVTELISSSLFYVII